VGKPYTVALPGNADVLSAVRQLQGQQSAAAAGLLQEMVGGWGGHWLGLRVSLSLGTRRGVIVHWWAATMHYGGTGPIPDRPVTCTINLCSV
jgi:hypothetical protein